MIGWTRLVARDRVVTPAEAERELRGVVDRLDLGPADALPSLLTEYDRLRLTYAREEVTVGRCELCRETVPDPELLDHLRVLHPAEYGDGPARWPDGGVVIEDATLEPRDFGAEEGDQRER